MPIQMIKRGGQTYYRYGDSGKEYKTKAEAERQAAAIHASGYQEKNSSGKKKGSDGKACWEGYRYGGTVDGKDVCTKVKR
jgi:hypothetical protein